MCLLDKIERRIIETVGKEQENWVEMYEEILNCDINIQIAKTHKDTSQIWSTDFAGGLKKNYLNSSERKELMERSYKRVEEIKNEYAEKIKEGI